MLGARENSKNYDITHANQFYQQASEKRRNFKNVVKARRNLVKKEAISWSKVWRNFELMY